MTEALWHQYADGKLDLIFEGGVIVGVVNDGARFYFPKEQQ